MKAQGEPALLERMFELLQTLHPRLPGVVPEALAHGAWGSRHVFIQRGVRGAPWFRVLDSVHGETAWCSLRDRVIAALRELHLAIRAEPRWTGRCQPAEVLRALCLRLEEAQIALPERLPAYLEAALPALESLGEVDAFEQHGDFCLNNVIVGERSIGIIDFEEFGLTNMPLHDEFGLAMSVADFSKPRGGPPRATTVAACLEGSVHAGVFGAEHLPGLFVHYLLWRIGQTIGSIPRIPKRLALIEELSSFLDDPSAYLA